MWNAADKEGFRKIEIYLYEILAPKALTKCCVTISLIKHLVIFGTQHFVYVYVFMLI